MLYRYYNQTVKKERLDRYKSAYSHLTLLKPQNPEPSEAGAGYFHTKKAPKKTVLASSYTFPETAETEDFIDQCIEEYITWLAQTELRKRQLALSPIEPYKTTDWSALQHKEATKDL